MNSQTQRCFLLALLPIGLSSALLIDALVLACVTALQLSLIGLVSQRLAESSRPWLALICSSLLIAVANVCLQAFDSDLQQRLAPALALLVLCALYVPSGLKQSSHCALLIATLCVSIGALRELAVHASLFAQAHILLGAPSKGWQLAPMFDGLALFEWAPITLILTGLMWALYRLLRRAKYRL